MSNPQKSLTPAELEKLKADKRQQNNKNLFNAWVMEHQTKAPTEFMIDVLKKYLETLKLTAGNVDYTQPAEVVARLVAHNQGKVIGLETAIEILTQKEYGNVSYE